MSEEESINDLEVTEEVEEIIEEKELSLAEQLRGITEEIEEEMLKSKIKIEEVVENCRNAALDGNKEVFYVRGNFTEETLTELQENPKYQLIVEPYDDMYTRQDNKEMIRITW